MTRLLALDALWFALIASVVGGVVAPFALARGRLRWVAVVQGAVYANFALVTVATVTMMVALLRHDFSISYVAQVGSRATPAFYTAISLWGALEGSILFWAWVLALYAAAVVYINRRREGLLVPYTGVVLLLIALFFHVLLVGPANPFHAVSPVPADGPGPNPLLQNHILMAVHPPLLYLGYVGMSVPFAFAVGALLAGQIASDEWIRAARRWTVTAWLMLTAAIIAGMWWSYEVLGWGGYWAWDPVENASFIPWLTATAFLHSVMVQERRGMLKLWNLNLIVGTFALTILGTFLTRSGIISSVHAFASGTIGYYFLAFIAVVLVAALVLVAGNSERLRTDGRFDSPLSRDAVFLVNNLLLTVFMFTVLTGTLFPLVAEAVRGVKVSVGEPFFNRMTLPVMVLLLFLMGVGPALPWRRGDPAALRRRLMIPAGFGIAAAVAAIALGTRAPYAVLTFLFAGFSVAANVGEFVHGGRGRRTARGEPLHLAIWRVARGTPRRFGGYLAHIGVLVFAVGIAASSTFRTESEANLKLGESMEVDGITARLREVWGREEPQRQVIGATVAIERGGDTVAVLSPRMNFYPTSQQPIPTPDVRSTLLGDTYLNLVAFRPDGSGATIKMIREPLVPWIWIGGGIICLGAVFGVIPPRSRGGEEVQA
ncbi:MAG: heme lyase CcmF/NrfE family subunit [Gemmatimonadetes bacterium]|nr:heme lyase CcmF/NrfE family subunit [Gemmatimonadota bacterium]